MEIIGLIMGIAIAIYLSLLLIWLRYDRLVKQIWRSLRIAPNNMMFTPSMVAELDEPVQRYFSRAIAPRTALATYVELQMNGSFRLQADAQWLPMQGSEIITKTVGFVWKAKIGKGLVRFSGADYYRQGQGRMRFSLWGLIPLVNAQDNNLDRSSIGRLAGEYAIWLPSALLPHNGVTWKAINQNQIQANLTIDNEPITLTLTIDANGKLLNISLPRWGNQTAEGDWQYLPFGGEIQEEKTFDGYTIPVKMSAGWWYGTDKYWTFFQPIIEDAQFS